MNQPTRCSSSQVYYLSLKYSSTRFGHPHVHHQGLNTVVAASCLPLERGCSSAVGRGRTGPTTTKSTATTMLQW